jgi:translation elongation factor EF-Ts
MKKLLLVAMSLIMACGVSFAQEAKEVLKERQEIAKLAKKELKAKSTKEARKEAKKLTKQGFVVFPGDLPLAKQLDRSYMMEYEYVKTYVNELYAKSCKSYI